MVVYLQSIFLMFGAFFMGRGAYMRHLKLPLGMSDFEARLPEYLRNALHPEVAIA